MISSPLQLSGFCLPVLLLVGAAASDERPTGERYAATQTQDGEKVEAKVNGLSVQYLEIVTPKVEATCDALAKAHGIRFGNPIAELGNARTADLKNGGRIGVRAPMRDTEKPVVRPYVLVDDIAAALGAAEKAGAQVAMPPMNLPGQGTFAIYVLGGIEHGLWQLQSTDVENVTSP